MDLQTAEKFAEDYKRLLRQAKKEGIDFGDAPPEVQQSLLALHQNALAVEYQKRKTKKENRLYGNQKEKRKEGHSKKDGQNQTPRGKTAR